MSGRIPCAFGAVPKPAKPERGTADCREHMALVAQLPCCICGARPVQVHHVIMGRHAQRKASDLETIPLCPLHHGKLHQSPDFWREFYGFDTDYLAETRRAVEQLKRNTIGGRA